MTADIAPAAPAMSADAFWASIEDAWAAAAASVPGTPAARAALCAPAESAGSRLAAVAVLDAAQTAFLAALAEALGALPRAALAGWDEQCARALHALDTRAVHAALDGSDDGFLYTRGFVVSVGRTYWDLVRGRPDTYGVPDAECERVCYLAAHMHNDRYGAWPRASVSRESCSNVEGWREEESTWQEVVFDFVCELFVHVTW